MKKVLLTGASGFLGKNLLLRLRQNPSYDVLAIAGHEDASLGICRVDLTDSEKTRECIGSFKADIVCHMGAIVDLSRSFDVANNTAHVNILGTLHLLEALKETPASSFIFASTEEVYGASPLPFMEDGPTDPPSPYAVTKQTSEHLLRLYLGKSFRSAFALRIATMYGPFMPSTRFLTTIINKAIRNEEIPLTSGTKKRDYVYVDDVVDACVAAMEHTEENITIINIGGGLSLSLLALVQKILELSGSSSVLRLGAIPDRIGESDEWLLDITKARKILGWRPKTDILTGLSETITSVKSSG